MEEAHLAAVGALVDPTRRRVYDVVAATGGPVGRDDVAGALEVGRTLAAFHLDKLAEVGLVDVTFARPAGRSGPGAGRPAKLYRVAASEVAVQVPPRAYPEIAVLLAEALELSGRDDIAFETARAAGRAAGRTSGQPIETLTARGYAPDSLDDVTVLRNCPFGVVAREFPPLICGMNLALLEGLVEAAGWPCAAALDPAPGRCCVTLSPKTGSSKTNE